MDRGFDLWSETFDQPVADLLAVRDSIARSIVATLRLSPQPVAGAATSDSAYRAYLLGRAERDPERAVAEFAEAVRLDSTFAPAWAGLAEAYAGELLADTRTPAEPAEAARAAADRALALDGRSARALLARGIVRLTYDRAWVPAGDDLRRAAALDPDDPAPAHWRSHLFLAQHLIDSSLAASAETISRSPLDPAGLLHLAWHYAMAGADTLAASTLAGVPIDSALLATDRHLPLLVEIAADSASAFTTLSEELAASPGRLDVLAELARLHALAERPDTARALLARMQAPRDSRLGITLRTRAGPCGTRGAPGRVRRAGPGPGPARPRGGRAAARSTARGTPAGPPLRGAGAPSTGRLESRDLDAPRLPGPGP